MGFKIFILSGPSGAGKTTLLYRLFRKKNIRQKFIRAISCTTRKKRQKERDGKDYYFLDKKTFLSLKKKGFFLETQRVLEDYYGTPRRYYLEAKKKKKDLILCIDVKGGMYLKDKLKDDKIITIFISTPKEKDLLERLKKRIEDEDFIHKRIKLAEKELHFSKHYDYVIINKDLKESLKKLEEILF